MSKLFKWVVKRAEFLGMETEEILIERPVLRRILGEKVEARKKIFVEVNHGGQKRNRTIGKREKNSSLQ